MTRETAVMLVQKVMDAVGTDDEVQHVLDELDRAFGCPTAYVADLIFWPKGQEPSAAEVVDQALAYRTFTL
jgi:hypothetical protein